MYFLYVSIVYGINIKLNYYYYYYYHYYYFFSIIIFMKIIIITMNCKIIDYCYKTKFVY